MHDACLITWLPRQPHPSSFLKLSLSLLDIPIILLPNDDSRERTFLVVYFIFDLLPSFKTIVKTKRVLLFNCKGNSSLNFERERRGCYFYLFFPFFLEQKVNKSTKGTLQCVFESSLSLSVFFLPSTNNSPVLLPFPTSFDITVAPLLSIESSTVKRQQRLTKHARAWRKTIASPTSPPISCIRSSSSFHPSTTQTIHQFFLDLSSRTPQLLLHNYTHTRTKDKVRLVTAEFLLPLPKLLHVPPHSDYDSDSYNIIFLSQQRPRSRNPSTADSTPFLSSRNTSIELQLISFKSLL